MTALLDNKDGPTPSHVSDAFGVYEDTAGLDSHVAKGWLYTEIDLGPGNIDLFSTHLNHKQDKRKFREARLAQVDELTEAITTHQKPENVTIVGGDLNVLGNRPEYDALVDRLNRRLGLQDVWLTRGGEVSMTSWFDDHDFWPVDGQVHNWAPGCQNYHEGCACDDYASGSYDDGEGSVVVDDNARLDYVFVEAPKESHDLQVDIKRVRRKLFPRLREQAITVYGSDIDGVTATHRETVKCATAMADCPTGSTSCYDEHYLSDHVGLELGLLASEQ